jgi:cytochrome d ubiquinol oxidase subunit II
MFNHVSLTIIWGFVYAFILFAYVALDGFDLGVGILFAARHSPDDRDLMVESFAPVWDGNETWIVIGAGGLLGAFHLAAAVLLPSVYLIVMAMLMALIFRGVAIEFRKQTSNSRAETFWNAALMLGSIIAAFCQGIIVGSVMNGTPIINEQYAGGPFHWLRPFPILMGCVTVSAYALLGSAWLVWRTSGAFQDRMRGLAKTIAPVTFALIAAAGLWTPFLNQDFHRRWFSPLGYGAMGIVVILFIALAYGFFIGIQKSRTASVPEWLRDKIPYVAVLAWFGLCYAALGFSLYPFILPPDLTIFQAASAPYGQGFLLIGAAIFIPIVLAYQTFAFTIFSGKVEQKASTSDKTPPKSNNPPSKPPAYRVLLRRTETIVRTKSAKRPIRSVAIAFAIGVGVIKIASMLYDRIKERR